MSPSSIRPSRKDAPTPEPIMASGGAPISLAQGLVAWTVENGEVEVYVLHDAGRDLLAVLERGEGFVTPQTSDHHRFQVVAKSNFRLAPSTPQDPDFNRLAQSWIETLETRFPAPTALVEIDTSEDPIDAVTECIEKIVEHLSQNRIAQDKTAVARLSQDPEAEETASSGVNVALQTLAAALKTSVDTRHAGDSIGSFQVPALCRHAGLRARRILLGEGWHIRDHGPLLVQREDDPQLDALIWDGRGYRSPAGVLLKGEEADGYDKVAYSVSAPLPSHVKTFWSLALFVLRKNNARDARHVVMAALLMAVLGVLTPLATVWLLSDIVPAGNAGLIFAVGIALGVAAIFTTLLSTAHSIAIARLAGHGAINLHAAVTDRILRLPTHFFKGFAPGDLNQRIGHFEAMRDLFMSVAFNGVLTAVLSVVYLIVLLAYDARLALISIGLVLVYVVAVVVARVVQMAPLRDAAELDGDVSALTFETLNGVAKLRVSAAEDRAMVRWLDTYDKERQAQLRAGKVTVVFSAFSDAYQTITLMVLFAAALYLTNTEASAGVFIGFLAAFATFQSAFVGLSSSLLQVYASQPLMDRARPLLDAQIEVKKGQKDPGSLQGKIEASGLTFSYQRGSAPVLNRLDFKAAPGQHVAIVGSSGSGKSTLLRLLLGFETPQNGSILYDGQELNSLDLTLVRSQIGVVLQASDLFAGSILDNIKGAAINAGLEECLQAAEKAGLSRDLEYFAMGIHTPITEAASTLSGGQRQRILIARALAAAPKILFFDEATSALDNATQAIVAKTLDSLNVTRVTIAHRLSTVRHADLIYVLQDGVFVEQGRYDDLMAQNGAFAKLAQRQLTED